MLTSNADQRVARPHPEANDVHVTGTFDDWGKSVQLNKVGDVWEKDVELPKADEKILYKFVVNDQWIIDPEAPQEDDGHGNVNNVLHPHDIKKKGDTVPEALTTSSAAPTSTTAAMAGQVPLEEKREATEGEIEDTCTRCLQRHV
jgi:1,4-alpha-glucan branching enzyme